MALAGYAIAAIVIIVVALLLYSFLGSCANTSAGWCSPRPLPGVKGPGGDHRRAVGAADGAGRPAHARLDVPPQDVISRDNVSVKVNAVVYFRVIDPERAIIQVENFLQATSQLAQTTLRSVLGKHDLDEMLAERDKLNGDIQEILDEQTDAWGIKVTNVEIKHVDLERKMVRAIARQAEAERERRAKVINAEGEQQAAEKLRGGAILAARPEAMQLRYLQTLNEIASEKSSTIVFPLPMDLLSAFKRDGKLAPTGRFER